MLITYYKIQYVELMLQYYKWNFTLDQQNFTSITTYYYIFLLFFFNHWCSFLIKLSRESIEKRRHWYISNSPSTLVWPHTCRTKQTGLNHETHGGRSFNGWVKSKWEDFISIPIHYTINKATAWFYGESGLFILPNFYMLHFHVDILPNCTLISQNV